MSSYFDKSRTPLLLEQYSKTIGALDLFLMLFFFSELGDKGAWTAMDYANKFEQFWQFDDNVERIDAREVNCDEFIERFEKINKPVVIEGLQVI